MIVCSFSEFGMRRPPQADEVLMPFAENLKHFSTIRIRIFQDLSGCLRAAFSYSHPGGYECIILSAIEEPPENIQY